MSDHTNETTAETGHDVAYENANTAPGTTAGTTAGAPAGNPAGGSAGNPAGETASTPTGTPTAESTNTSMNDGADTTFIAPERIRKAKRTKIILIIVILLLVGALGGLTYLGYTIFMEGMTNTPSGIKPITTITDGEVEDPSAPTEVKFKETSIPNLVALFGLSVEEVRTRLGNDFQLTKTDSVTDDTNPAVRQLATFSYVPSTTDASGTVLPNVSMPSESIYASLDEGGKVIDIYYVCDMQLLGYPERPFEELLAGSEVVSGALAAAGVQPRDLSYNPPNMDESTIYDNPNSTNRKVVKQTTIFSGRTTTTELPTVWTMTVTYDFGAGVESTAEFREATRTINLKLA